MKNITIFTTFRSADPAYSLNRVVQQQLKMFRLNGYKVRVIVAKGFVPIEEYSHVECIEIPDVPVSNDVRLDETFNTDVSSLMEALKPILDTTDVMLTHDLVYQPAALKHNIAFRELLRKDSENKTTFLHWVHSATEPGILKDIRGGGEEYLEILKTPFPRSFYIAFNAYSVPRVAKWFGCEESSIKVIPHPHDFTEDMHPETIRIIEKGNLLARDVVMLYPVRLDRGKQVEHVLNIAAAVKKNGQSIGVVIVDFHSTGGDKLVYKEELKKLAIGNGLAEGEFIFTSELDGPDKPLIGSFPHRVISELFDISNTFILPSRSETYSLIAQEAMAKRNFCILNFDFPPFRSIYGDGPAYAKFSSTINMHTGLDGETNTQYANAKEYWKSWAVYIKYVQNNTRVLAQFNFIRQDRNLQAVFKQYIEPILYADHDFTY